MRLLPGLTDVGARRDGELRAGVVRGTARRPLLPRDVGAAVVTDHHDRRVGVRLGTAIDAHVARQPGATTVARSVGEDVALDVALVAVGDDDAAVVAYADRRQERLG